MTKMVTVGDQAPTILGNTLIHTYKRTYTNAKAQIQKHIDKNKNTQILTMLRKVEMRVPILGNAKIHKYKGISTKSKIHKY